MSALEHIDSMDPNAPGNEVFARVREMLETLGFKLQETWSHGTICSAVVKTGRKEICRLHFSTLGSTWNLLVHPADPASAKVIVKANERIDNPEPMWVNDQLDHVESLFRALLVRTGKLAQHEFPSEYALKQWAARAATITLPGERSPRRPFSQDVVIRPGDFPGSQHPSKSQVSVALVRAARLLDQDFDPARAIEVAISAARQTDAQTNEDPALNWLARTARYVIRDRRRDMDLAWDNGSYDAVLVFPHIQRGDHSVPYTGSAPEPAAENESTFRP